MNTMDSLIQSISDGLTGFVNNCYQTCAIWMNRSISYITLIPQRMQYSNNYAIAVFLTANVISFLVVNLLANSLEERVNKAVHEPREKKFNFFLINGVVTGGAALIWNAALCRATSYSLSAMTFTGIMTTYIGLRVILSFLNAEKRVDEAVLLQYRH